MAKQARDLIRRAGLLHTLLLAVVTLVVAAEPAIEPTKSRNDTRNYAYFELPNELRVLLVSDPDTDKAAAALDVRVGSGSDPEDRQGLAHFLEHMLFLGTQKYPRAGEYQAYIASHGGSHNAYTGFDDTNYFFEIDKDHLEPALDRFARFFTEPLFTADYVQREKNAVNSEFQLQLKNDGWRSNAAFKHVINPAHPLSRFSVGSLESLEDREETTVREALLDFYQLHYSANLMTLVVLGKETLPQLRSWVQERFAAIPNTNAKALEIAEPLFAAGRLPARLNITPVKDTQSLTLTFPIPAPDAWYREKPTTQLAHLLGHEGEGSLLSLLKRKHWAEALAASGGQSLDKESTFTVNIRLTDTGLQHIDDIVELVFAYLDRISEHGIQEWMFSEQQRLAELDFRFKEPSSPVRYASGLAKRLQRVPPEDVLRAPYAMDRFDAGLINDYLTRLEPNNLLLTVEARGVETAQVDPWFGARYGITPIAPQTLARWLDPQGSDELAMPAKNLFIPDRVALTKSRQASAIPELLDSKEGVGIWYKQDQQFAVPRSDLQVAVRSEIAGQNPRNLVLTKLYLSMVEDQLAEFSYPALLAGLAYGLTPAVNGFSINISGYSDKQDRLLAGVVDALKGPNMDEERFLRISQELARSLDNASQETPYRQALAELPVLMIQPFWSKETQSEALEALSLNDLEQFVPKLLAEIEVEALVHGNLSSAEVMVLTDPLRTRLLDGSVTNALTRPTVIDLADDETPIRELEIDNVNSAVAIYYQGARQDVELRARYALIAQVLSSPFYQELRTERQLGYVVFASPMPLLEVPGMVFVVQSPVAGPVELEGYVDRFLTAYASSINAMTDSEFEKHRAGLLSRLLERPTTLTEQTDRYWTDIRFQHTDFDTRERLVESLRAISKADFQRDYQGILLAETPRRLVVRSYAGGKPTPVPSRHSGPAEVVITDPVGFKSERQAVIGAEPTGKRAGQQG